MWRRREKEKKGVGEEEFGSVCFFFLLVCYAVSNRGDFVLLFTQASGARVVSLFFVATVPFF